MRRPSDFPFASFLFFLFVSRSVHSETWTYAHESVTQEEWEHVIDEAAAEILWANQFPVRCGIIPTYGTQKGDGSGDYARDIEGRLTSSLEPRIDGFEMAPLKTHFISIENARIECYSYWPCNTVQVFSLPGTTSLLALFYSGASVSRRPSLSSSEALGHHEEALASNWIATFSFNRTLGYDCPNDRTSVDAVQFVRMWGGRFGSEIKDVNDVLGVSDSSVMSDEEILQFDGAIREYYNTFGHLKRMWPNYNCSLTPLLHDPSSGCAAQRCPSVTVCPSGYRLRSEFLGACLGGWSGATSQETVLPYSVQPVINFQTETYHWGLDAIPYGVPDHERNMSMFNSLRFEDISSNLPCGFEEGRGGCVHSRTAHLDVPSRPYCSCFGASVPVAGDVGCQLDGVESLTTTREVGDCLTETGRLICNEVGTCTFHNESISWGSFDIFGSGDVVSCDCDEPFISPRCTKTFCDVGGDIGDCHELGRGTCVESDSTPNTWSCKCHYPFTGEHCEFEDTPLSSDASQMTCYIRQDIVESPPVDSSLGEWLLCSGYGECSTSYEGCICHADESGRVRTGRRCEYAPCDHVSDCGYLGACFHGVDTDTGRRRTDCMCAVRYNSFTEDDSDIIGLDVDISAEPGDLGIPLASLSTVGDRRCIVDLCVHGQYQAIVEPVDGVFNIAPQGRCDCIRAVQDPDFSLVTWENVTSGNFSIPSHPFIPTFTREPSGEPFIASFVIGAVGVLCEQPLCPTYIDATTQQVLQAPCSVGETRVSEEICLSCAEFPDIGFCRQTNGFGGYCDCAGGESVQYQAGLLLAEGAPQEDIDAVTPYYLGVNGDLGRFESSGRADDPMCHPFCKNGGVWDKTEEECNCANTGYQGVKCSVPRCPHGTWTLGAVGDCSFCDTGWFPPESCDVCDTGYTGDDCTLCDEGYFRPYESGVCELCSDHVSCNTASGATTSIDCSSASSVNPPTCVCGSSYVGPECRSCAIGFTHPAGFNDICVSCEAVLDCDATGTASALCTSTEQVCICKDPLMDSLSHKCSRCRDGYQKVNDACLPCDEALGCFGAGTLEAVCSMQSDPADARCVCDAESGFIGPRCDQCDTLSGWFWDSRVNRCSKCDHECGDFGLPLCEISSENHFNVSRTCLCTHGRSGEDCNQCTECGIGGICAETNSSSLWCSCIDGYQKDPVKTVLFGETEIPCDVCDTATSFFDEEQSLCVFVSERCGTIGIDTARSIREERCVCLDGFTHDSTSNTTCGSCNEGYAGPACELCSPACSLDHGLCSWSSDFGVPKCSCRPGYRGTSCELCSDGYVLSNVSSVAPGSTFAFECVECPICGPHGTCVWDEVLGRAICQCKDGFTHQIEGLRTTRCSSCDRSRSPQTCSACPNCPVNSHCDETLERGVFCTCNNGTRQVHPFRDSFGVQRYPCVSEVVALMLDHLSSVSPNQTKAFLEDVIARSSSLGIGDAINDQDVVVIPFPNTTSLLGVVGVQESDFDDINSSLLIMTLISFGVIVCVGIAATVLPRASCFICVRGSSDSACICQRRKYELVSTQVDRDVGGSLDSEENHIPNDTGSRCVERLCCKLGKKGSRKTPTKKRPTSPPRTRTQRISSTNRGRSKEPRTYLPSSLRISNVGK